MPNQIDTWSFIAECLQRREQVILLYVVESLGSSPGRAGFSMAVSENGITQGSIGGGIMEHKFVELARARMSVDDHQCTLHRQIHNKTAKHNQSGMICSGEQTNIIHSVTSADLVMITRIIEKLTNKTEGCLEISPAGITVSNSISESGYGLTLESDEKWCYLEKITLEKHLIIVGGGHCALALSRQMKLLNFTITLYEERSQLPTFVVNNYADEKVVVGNYADLEHLIPVYANACVVVMTVGYRTDDIAIRALKDKSFIYLGVLGSRKKIETMKNQYKAESFSNSWLDSLHAPAGLPINSHTPEEIAVSIAAEIISLKICRK